MHIAFDFFSLFCAHMTISMYEIIKWNFINVLTEKILYDWFILYGIQSDWLCACVFLCRILFDALTRQHIRSFHIYICLSISGLFFIFHWIFQLTTKRLYSIKFNIWTISCVFSMMLIIKQTFDLNKTLFDVIICCSFQLQWVVPSISVHFIFHSFLVKMHFYNTIANPEKWWWWWKTSKKTANILLNKENMYTLPYIWCFCFISMNMFSIKGGQRLSQWRIHYFSLENTFCFLWLLLLILYYLFFFPLDISNNNAEIIEREKRASEKEKNLEEHKYRFTKGTKWKRTNWSCCCCCSPPPPTANQNTKTKKEISRKNEEKKSNCSSCA